MRSRYRSDPLCFGAKLTLNDFQMLIEFNLNRPACRTSFGGIWKVKSWSQKGEERKKERKKDGKEDGKEDRQTDKQLSLNAISLKQVALKSFRLGWVRLG